MSYVDGFVLAVPESNLDAYKKLASAACEVWKKHGALDYKECVLDDPTENPMCSSFLQAFPPREGETIVFAFITYPSRQARDAINAKVMEDPAMKDACDPNNMPFDPKRMAMSGFRTIVE